MGRLYAARQMHDRAARELEEAVRLDPQSAEAQRDLGVAYSALGQREQALAAFGRAVRLYLLAGALDQAAAVEDLERKLEASRSGSRRKNAR
jgi:tetratricopeptide (TPR) repeat protein